MKHKNKKQMSGMPSCEKVKEVKMTKPTESQKDMVQGQGKVLAEKKRSATWY
jgi:hypothetical protein